MGAEKAKILTRVDASVHSVVHIVSFVQGSALPPLRIAHASQ